MSDLLPARSSGGRGGGRLSDEVEAIVRDLLRSRYLTRQRRTVATVCRARCLSCSVGSSGGRSLSDFLCNVHFV